jgi:hypothetical protein
MTVEVRPLLRLVGHTKSEIQLLFSQSCINFCDGKNFVLAGVEYGVRFRVVV